MTSERNDPPIGSRPLGTPMEPTSAAPSSRPADAGKPADAKRSEPKPSETKPATAAKSAASAAGSSPAGSSATAAPRTEAKPAPSTPSPRRGLGVVGAAFVALIVSVAVAAAMIVTAPRWTPLLGDNASSAPAAAPAADPRIAALAARVDQLAARPASDSAPTEALRTQLAKLQEDMARLAKEQDATADALAQVAGEIDDIKPAGTGDTSALERRLAKLEQQLADAGAAFERARNLRGDMDALIAELGKVGERDARFEGRMAALEKEAGERRGIDGKAAEASRAAAIVALGSRLRQAVTQGQDSAADLASLKVLAGDDAELAAPIAQLTPLAGKVLATPEALRQRFAGVARDIVTADAGDQAGSWWEKALARLQNLVSIRRTGPDVAGEDAEARVAQAETALRAGRLDQAVAALKPLTGQAAKAAAPWLTDAEALLGAQAAADRIVARGALLLATVTGRAPATR